MWPVFPYSGQIIVIVVFGSFVDGLLDDQNTTNVNSGVRLAAVKYERSKRETTALTKLPTTSISSALDRTKRMNYFSNYLPRPHRHYMMRDPFRYYPRMSEYNGWGFLDGTNDPECDEGCQKIQNGFKAAESVINEKDIWTFVEALEKATMFFPILESFAYLLTEFQLTISPTGSIVAPRPALVAFKTQLVRMQNIMDKTDYKLGEYIAVRICDRSLHELFERYTAKGTTEAEAEFKALCKTTGLKKNLDYMVKEFAEQVNSATLKYVSDLCFDNAKGFLGGILALFLEAVSLEVACTATINPVSNAEAEIALKNQVAKRSKEMMQMAANVKPIYKNYDFLHGASLDTCARQDIEAFGVQNYQTPNKAFAENLFKILSDKYHKNWVVITSASNADYHYSFKLDVGRVYFYESYANKLYIASPKQPFGWKIHQVKFKEMFSQFVNSYCPFKTCTCSELHLYLQGTLNYLKLKSTLLVCYKMDKGREGVSYTRHPSWILLGFSFGDYYLVVV